MVDSGVAGPVLQQGGPAEPSPVFMIVWLAAVVVVIAGVWKTFEKANQPGWAALIPFYNFYVMLDIGDNEWWWLLVLFVPIANLFAMYKIFAGVSKAFGKGVGWALGLWFLGFVFWPLLGFGDYTFQGPAS
jgi:hypothetical protein